MRILQSGLERGYARWLFKSLSKLYGTRSHHLKRLPGVMVDSGILVNSLKHFTPDFEIPYFDFSKWHYFSDWIFTSIERYIIACNTLTIRL